MYFIFECGRSSQLFLPLQWSSARSSCFKCENRSISLMESRYFAVVSRCVSFNHSLSRLLGRSAEFGNDYEGRHACLYVKRRRERERNRSMIHSFYTTSLLRRYRLGDRCQRDEDQSTSPRLMGLISLPRCFLDYVCHEHRFMLLARLARVFHALSFVAC